MSWARISFENIYSIPSKNGLTRPSKIRGTGYKMINMGELFANDFIGNIPMELVPMNEKELQNMLVEDGDLLFARQSLVLAGAGKCSLVFEQAEPTTFESHIIRVRLNAKIADPHFYFYYFKSPTSGMRSIVIQGVQAGIRGNDLKKLSVSLPPLNTQKRIASVLSAYDDLIENNRRRIALLEEAARLLYREWFVHFRFPGHEHVKIIDGVPEGWHVKKVGELLARLKAKPKIRKDEYLEQGSFPCVDQGQRFVGGFTDNLEAIYRAELPLIVFGDHTRALKFVDFPFARGADGTQICQSNDTRLSQEMFYWALVSIDLSNYFYARHFKFLKDQEILIPDQSLADNFTRFSRDSFKQINISRQQNTELLKARDLLLPRLMDGRLEV